MKALLRAKWRLLLAVAVVLALGVAVSLGLTRADQAGSDAQPRPGVKLGLTRADQAETTTQQLTSPAEESAEAQPCGENCEGYPEYAITIKGNTDERLNGTWELRQLRDSCVWNPLELMGPDRTVSVFCSRSNKWILFICTYYYREGKITDVDVTLWEAPNITGYPDGAPFEYVRGPYDGGTIMVHER